MTLKPPTKTFPKLVMKEWPVSHVTEISQEGYEKLLHALDNPKPPTQALVDLMREHRKGQALSDFTRVVEETGVLDQGRSQKEKSRDE